MYVDILNVRARAYSTTRPEVVHSYHRSDSQTIIQFIRQLKPLKNHKRFGCRPKTDCLEHRSSQRVYNETAEESQALLKLEIGGKCVRLNSHPLTVDLKNRGP